MAGTDVERTGTDDTRVSFLAHVQEASRAAWSTHHEQHDLEDKALALAVGSVKDAHVALRELIDTQLAALRAAVLVEHADLERRSVERDDAARDVAEVRSTAAERWIKDVLDQQWTAHLREHEAYRRNTEQRMEAWVEAHEQTHSLIQLAVDKANQSLDRRLEGMNEFRAQLDRMVSTLVTLNILDVRLAAIAEQESLVHGNADKQRDVLAGRVNDLERTRANLEGRFAMLSAGLGGLLLLIEFVFHFYKP